MSGAAPQARAGCLAPLLLVLLTVVLHAPSLGHDLLQDDEALIARNPAVLAARQDPRAALRLFTGDALSPVRPDGVLSPDLSSQALHRPLTLAAWAALLRAPDKAGAAPAWPYHLASLIAHAAVVLLLWRVVQRLFGRAWLASVAALIFALHPLPVAAVAHAAALGTLLSTAAVLAGLLCWHAATSRPAGPGRTAALAGLLTCLALGLLCHEQALLLIPAVALAEALIPRRAAAGDESAGAPARSAIFAGMLVVLAADVALRSIALPHLLPDVASFDPIANPLAREPLPVRLLNAPVLVALPARLLLVPTGLSADYSFEAIPVARSLATLAAGTGLLVTLALLGAGLALARRDPAASFGLLGFLGATLAGSGLLPLGAEFSETRSYLPAALGCLALASFVDALGRRLRLAARPGLARVALLLALAAGGALAARTLARQEDYRSTLSLYEAARSVVPRSARVHERLGTLLNAEHRYDEAVTRLQSALAVAPDCVAAALGLADALAAQGRPREALVACDQLVVRRTAAVAAATPSALRAEQGLLRLALARRARGRLGRGNAGGAEADLRAAVALPGAGVEPQMRLAHLLELAGRPAEAVPFLRDALLEDPDNPQALYELARGDLAAGDEEAARRVLEKLSQTSRGKALTLLLDAVRLQAEALASGDKDQLEQALALFDDVRSLDPSLPEPWLVRGRHRLQRGQAADALPDLQAAVEHAPGDPVAWLFLARAQNALDRPEEALASAQRLAVLDAGPDTLAVMTEAHLRLGRVDDLTRDCTQLDAMGLDPIAIVLGRVASQHDADRFDDAVATLALLRRVPGYGRDPRLLRELADVQMDAGRPADALAALDEEADIEAVRTEGPRDGLLPFNRARALTQQHRAMEAAAVLEGAEVLTPAGAPLRPLLLQRRAELLLDAEGPFLDPDEAARLAAEALASLVPADALRAEELTAVAIGAALAGGDLAGAVGRADDAVRQFPGSSRWNAAATALRLATSGDVGGARTALAESGDRLLRRIAGHWRPAAGGG